MHIQFAELPVADFDRAIAFYADAFACTVAADVVMNEAGDRWVELAIPGAETNLHFLKRAEQAMSDMSVLVFVMEDVADTVAQLRQRGVAILAEPHSPAWEPGKVVAEIRDSEGNRIVLSGRGANS